MPTVYPIAAAGERLPKRARPLAAGVRAAVKLLVWGAEGDEGRRPATLAEAAAAGSMRVDTLRRWLRRQDARNLIAAEKRALLAWATAANPQALMSIRDTSQNDAARVRAALALEELEAPRDGKGISVTVNNQTNVATQIRPGYVVRLPSDLTLASSETLPAGDAERR
jgi:hypothetical protein